jgi:hypothetical protein
MFSIFVQNFVPIYDDHKELSLSKETNFKTKVETLEYVDLFQYISKWHEISSTYVIFYDL